MVSLFHRATIKRQIVICVVGLYTEKEREREMKDDIRYTNVRPKVDGTAIFKPA